MNALDILYLVIMIFFALFGAMRGLIRGAFGLGGAVLGVVAAKIYYPNLAGQLAFWFGGSFHVLNTVAFCLIFLGTLIVMVICGRILTRLANLVFLGWLNRLLGFFLGLAKGAVVCMICSLLINMTVPQASALLKDSKIHQGLQSGIAMFPGDSMHKLTDKRDELEKYIKEKGKALQDYSERNLSDPERQKKGETPVQ